MIVAIVVPVLLLCKLDYQCTLEVLTMAHTLVHMGTTFAVTVIVATVFQRPVSQITEDKTVSVSHLEAFMSRAFTDVLG